MTGNSTRAQSGTRTDDVADLYRTHALGLIRLALMLVAARVWGEDVAGQRTLLLSALVLLGLTTLLRTLWHAETSRLRGDRLFYGYAAAALPVYLAAMYVPLAAWYFDLTPLRLGQWLWVLAFVLPAHTLLLWTDRRRRKA